MLLITVTCFDSKMSSSGKSLQYKRVAKINYRQFFVLRLFYSFNWKIFGNNLINLVLEEVKNKIGHIYNINLWNFRITIVSVQTQQCIVCVCVLLIYILLSAT
jgi:hypothetical protein